MANTAEARGRGQAGASAGARCWSQRRTEERCSRQRTCARALQLSRSWRFLITCTPKIESHPGLNGCLRGMDCPRMRPPAQRRAARCTLTMRRIAALAITFAAVVVLAGVPASAADSSDSEPERPAEGSRRGEGGGVGAGGGGERGGVEMPVSSPRSAAPKGNGDMQKRGGLKVKPSGGLVSSLDRGEVLHP